MPRKRAKAEPPSPPSPPEREQLVPTWEWELRARSEGWELIAGVDEAGRGPLAGPVVAAALVLPPEASFEGLRDSKCLAEPERESLYREILEHALCWSAVAVEPEEIDRVNILRATHLAMARALAALEPCPHGALIDGLPVRGLPYPHRAIVDGDALCVSIAAASVIAKVTRDRLMVRLDEEHPGYGFARHKGYSTPEHLAALRDLGPSPIHRRSFRPVAELLYVQELPLFSEEFESIDDGSGGDGAGGISSAGSTDTLGSG